MLALYITVWIVCVIECMGLHKYKFVDGYRGRDRSFFVHGVLELFVLIAVFILITSNRYGVDITVYNSRYLNLSNIYNLTTTERLYVQSSLLCKNLGLTFYEFRALLTLITGGLQIYVLKKLRVNIFWYMLFYLPVLIFMDSMLVRNAAAFGFLILAAFIITDEKKRYSGALYIILLVLGIGFHTMYIFYIPLILYKSKQLNKKKLIGGFAVFCSVFVSALTFLNGNSIPFVDVLYNLVLSESDARTERYLTSGNFGFLYPCFMLVLTVFLLYLITKNSVNKGTRASRFIEFSYLLTQLTFCSVPFIMMNMNYYRLPRNTFIFAIISTALFVGDKENQKQKKREYTLLLILISIFWFVFEIFIYQSAELIVDPVLKDGVLFFMED